ncbi:MAG: kelch repeat-containing protein [Candidatus Cybelea sp.]
MNWRFRLALPSSSLLAVTALAALSACAGSTPGVPLSTAQGMSGSHSQAFAEPATSNTWTMGAPAPTRQFTGAAAAVGTNIYLVGGENHTAVLNENDVYNTLTNTWSKAKRMPTKRATLAAAAVNGLVYAIGGSTFTGTPLTTVEAYNPVSDTWSAKAPLPTAVDSMSATVDKGLIYVVGGFVNGNGTPFNGVETYNPATNAWTSVAPLNVAKSFSFIATVGSEIVAAAGSVGTGPTTDNEVYDPTSNAWTNKRSAHLARYGGCMGSIGGSLYAAGGLKFVPFRSAAKELYAYNVAADRWTKLARLPSPMIAPASATMNGQLYCIGGSPRFGQPTFSQKVQIYQP